MLSLKGFASFFSLFCLLRHTKHEHSSKEDNFFFTHAITTLSLFTYSVCDEKIVRFAGNFGQAYVERDYTQRDSKRV